MKIISAGNYGIADRRLANTVTWHLNPPQNFNMRIPDEVKKCVTYLGVEESVGSFKEIKYRGTGFLIGVPAKKISGGFMFLVTAKHVAEKLTDSNFFVRVNTRDGKSANLKVKTAEWWFHPTDKAADVALFPLGLDTNLFDFLSIPIVMFLTENIRQSKGIGAGDEVFITGLFVHHKGNAKNIPIIRTGNIAMIPDERIPIKKFGDMEAYLIESRSIGGLSGSPVFTFDNNGVLATSIYLMGLIHGHWAVDSETITDETSEDTEIKAGINVGIAIVTPASKILDIINCEELVKHCENLESNAIANNSPTPDKT